MTKNYKIVGLCFAVLIAFSAIMVTSASAETTLLAEWLWFGAAITVTLAITGTGELIFEDVKSGIGVTCAAGFDGTVSPDGKGTTTALLTPGGVEVTLAAPLLCKSHKSCEESATDIEVSLEGLPLSWTAFLMENGEILLLWDMQLAGSCLVLGIKVSEECSWPDFEYGTKNVVNGVELVGTGTPLGSCTVGGSSSGSLTFVAGNLFTTVESGTLSFSSE